MKKRISFVTWILPVLLLASSCQRETPRASSSGERDRLRVAMLLPGEITDSAWNQVAYEGLRTLEKEGLIDSSYTERTPNAAAEVERIARGYASDGYDLIIGHGFNFGEPLFRLAPEFPKAAFAWAGGTGQTAANVADYQQPFYEASYLTGILGGGATASGIVGGLAGFDVPSCHAMLAAFELGARTIRPDVRQLVTFTGDWQDIAKAKEAVFAQAEQGADVVVACGEGVALGAIEAAKERNLTTFGYLGNMSSLAPQNIVGLMLWDTSKLWRQMVLDTKNNSFNPGKLYNLGVREDALVVKLNPRFQGTLSGGVRRSFEQQYAQIKSGEFEVPFIPK